ncbi:hypothetical protein [Nocardioides mesophilus]|uniref:Alpha/beta hydrolase n=1 Tax=Nocardioides mesophilus TaxID=433659 RepID=A0A7G9RFL3_9ACTN|nr:hypothetical protein [Nocardioides mesophilus]QNN54388.1 hypothetical protein H9L09_08695 [Nocardioides mesophilus]
MPVTPATSHVRSRRLHGSLVAGLATAVTLSLGLVGGAADARQGTDDRADPRGSGTAEGTQPLPGYTVDNPPLAPLTVDGAQTRVLQGIRDHAAYDIEIPPDWNGELVMWAHGFRGDGTVLTVDSPGYGLRRTFAEQGYAWAASSYARNAYDVATGVTTTHDLARYAATVLPRNPTRLYVAGVSMGGHIIGRSLEQYPHFYDGALPMCGVLGDQELFDYFLGFNLVAQQLAGLDAYPVPDDYQTAVVPDIKKKLGLSGGIGTPITNPLGAQLRDVTTNLTGGPRPGDDAAFTVWKDFLFTLASPDDGSLLALNPGRVAQNQDVAYSPNVPVEVDATVERVAPADPEARNTRRLTTIPRIEGRPKVPTLTLHGLGDLFVPFSMEQVYAREVADRGRSHLLVQRAIRAAGHCEFTPTEVRTAWDDLTDWVESRDRGRHGAESGSRRAHGPRLVERPAGDDVLSPNLVASPTYGCEFTDPAGYDAPRQFPTRSLYPRCPVG